MQALIVCSDCKMKIGAWEKETFSDVDSEEVKIQFSSNCGKAGELVLELEALPAVLPDNCPKV